MNVFYILYGIFSIDPEQKDQLMEVIEKLLSDKTTVSMIIKFCK